MHTNGRALVLICSLLVSSLAMAQSARRHAEQTHFSAEDAAVKSPVHIPSDVMEILGKDELVHDALDDQNLNLKQLPETWFSASAIRLGPKTTRLRDLIIAWAGPLPGANMNTFWIFCATPEGYRLALNAPVHDLEALNTRWKGYRELELSAESAVTFTAVWFRWDGTKYAEFREKSSDM